jgi:8-oxo-dGTP pyrophosphatase MutT (NUDIX family)
VGFVGQLRRAFRVYYRTAWWGLVSPRLGNEQPLTVIQAVVERTEAGRPQVLLSVRSDLHGWELPGGNPEPGEDERAALAREVREETGLEVVVGRRVGSYLRTGFRPHTAHVHLCRPTGGVLRPSSETPRVEWFDQDALPDTLFPWYRAPLADAFAGGDSPTERHEYQGIGSILAGMRIDLRMRASGDRAGLPPARPSTGPSTKRPTE